MAIRTIKTIQDQIIEKLPSGLSSSASAEWRLWTYVIAAAIYSFELILEAFKTEIENLTQKITPGTKRWYAEMSYRFQNGDSLSYDNKTATLYYPKISPEKQIIKRVAISEKEQTLFIKVAKTDDKQLIVPLSEDELYNFKGYIEAVKFVGVKAEIISTTADKIAYNLDIYYDSAIAQTSVEKDIKEALTAFKLELSFDGKIYSQKLVDVVMACSGVVTVELKSLLQKGSSSEDFTPVNVMAELESGYFEYDQQNCYINFKTA